MAQLTVDRKGELGRALFSILLDNPEGLPAQEAIALLRKRVPPTDHEKGYYKSGVSIYDRNIRFTTIVYVKAGWLLKEKGRWTITELGSAALQKYTQPEDFHRAASKLYTAWKQSRATSEETDTESEEAGSSASITFDQAEEQAWSEIQAYLSTINPYEFQRLVASLLRAMGYHVSWIAPPGKDGGLDILAWNDPLGTRPPRMKVQVKRHESPIGVGDLRSFMALLAEDDVGIFVSTGGFTKDAEDEARTQPTRKVTLLNLERLYELWVEHYEKLDQDAKDIFPLKPIYFLSPED
jgi:restriction system protein